MSIVSAKMLTKVYAGKIQAVDNLDLEIEAGQIFGFFERMARERLRRFVC